MHRVRFRDPDGELRTGEWVDENGTVEISASPGATGRVAFPDEVFVPDEVDVRAPADPSKIVCVGRNYAEHADERNEDLPERPLLFLKGPNTVAHHNQTVELLAGKERIEHEAELAVVIGTQCRGLTTENAMDAVAGFTCFNDISNRDDQSIEQNWVRGKAFDGAAPMGPVLASPDEVPADATIELRCNGEVRQSGTREQMIFSVPELLTEITQYLTLEPGDVVATGTPAGVDKLDDGDEIEITIEGVGTLSHSISIPES